METGYTAIFWFVLVSVLIVPVALGISAILRPRRRYPGKSPVPYECGEAPVGSAWAQFNIRFYIVAVVFIIFDVEVVALFPCAVLFKDAVQQGTAGLIFIKLFLFISLLLAGLLYCWVRGDLEWVKGVLNSPSKKTT